MYSDPGVIHMEEQRDNVVIEFKHVSKIYKLYKNDKKRLLGVFFKKVPYKEKKAINDVSLKVHKGEAVALFGRNGAGKSTILKMITGVIYPTSGEIIVKGRVSALLELSAGFDQDMTGRENIMLKGKLMGLEDEEIRSLEPEIVDFADIEEYMDQPVRTYSSGMKARLGFAINVSIRPEILIIDEALSVGDAAFRKKCIRKINSIMEGEITLLFVTHSTGVAQEFCKRGIIMKKGKIVFDSDIAAAAKKYDDSIK
ncbi:MAG: ABC transporter ATP-binding protein [Anaerovoracaceae bacterium]|jgi:teichoic acid transport system ATP-binding protein